MAVKHYVYILECGDKSFYTGYTTDPERRLQQHNKGTASKYTRSRLPVSMVYLESVSDRSTGLKREHAIKKLTREKKMKLIRKGGNSLGPTRDK
ncbi:GIY-YIG catalytic domain protein [Aedoeadaptatus nemausensis]|uniref:GIY-YIG catalytic domain protein n=1 Tax=Aedoeadaptatus nemausensis TaxID=2582829 RepID=A0A6V6XZD5_9FIRM|nr:GIY-YIG nuclease family protein [Peptoniphilus nemausensis]CAC9924794.1 GIY-YIG catalytic domain protein [Peptoniphilus nemausensis]